MQVLKSLQAGRGLAAMAVAAYHLSEASQQYLGTDTFSAYTARGDLGVDFFFVLSGFIILQAHRADIGHPEQLRGYLSKRLLRIYPIYWLYTTLAIAGALVAGHAVGLAHAADWFSTYALVRASDVQTPLRQGWTLFHEIVFYAMFATLIWNLRWGVVVFAAWAAAMLGLFFYPSHDHPSLAGNVFGAYNLNFFLGMAAYLWTRRAGVRGGWAAVVLGLAVFTLAYQLQQHHVEYTGRGLAYAVSFALLIGGAATLELHGAWVDVPLLGLLGDASYSVYLLHEHAENYALRIAARLHLHEVLAPGLLYLLVLAATAAVGVLAFRVVEKPLLGWLRGRWPRGRSAQAAV